MQQYISQLNEAQQQPVFQKDGPMIIIAGAGSGKTRVLTVRISYLLVNVNARILKASTPKLIK